MADNNTSPNPQDTSASTQMFRAFVNEPQAQQQPGRPGAVHHQPQEKGKGGLYAVVGVVVLVVIAVAVYLAVS